MLCYAMLCYAMLRYANAVQCCAVLCDAMLCYDMLAPTNFLIIFIRQDERPFRISSRMTVPCCAVLRYAVCGILLVFELDYA